MKRAIVTGASGFIGKALTCALLAQGAEVCAVVRDPRPLDSLADTARLRIVTADFDEYGQLAQRIGGADYDAFFHMAWAGYGAATNDIAVQAGNIRPAGEAAAAAAQLGCRRFALAGSCYEYQVDHALGDPALPLGPSSIYGAAKSGARALCNAVAHRSGVEFIGVFFSNVFGPGDHSRRTVNFFLHKMLAGEPLDLIQGDVLYDWTYIDDVVDGVLAAVERGASGQTYYVGSRQLTPYRELVQCARDAIDSPSELRFGAYPDTSHIDYRTIDLFQLYRDTGYLPSCDFAQSIRSTAAWVRGASWGDASPHKPPAEVERRKMDYACAPTMDRRAVP